MTMRRKTPSRLVAAIAIPFFALAVAAGCSSQVDSNDLAQKIQTQLQAQKPDAGPIKVSCPSGIEGKKGNTATCTLTASDGSTLPIKVTFTSDNLDFTAEVQSSN